MVTDNRAVELIFKNPKRDPPMRIRRWVLRLAGYRFTIAHKPGAQNIADYMSSLPVGDPELRVSDGAEEYVAFIADHATPKAISRVEIASATTEDPELQDLIKTIRGETSKDQAQRITIQNRFERV